MPITYNSLSLQKLEIPEPNTQFQSLIHPETRRKGKHALGYALAVSFLLCRVHGRKVYGAKVYGARPVDKSQRA
jgi:hypothetical protein